MRVSWFKLASFTKKTELPAARSVVVAAMPGRKRRAPEQVEAEAEAQPAEEKKDLNAAADTTTAAPSHNYYEGARDGEGRPHGRGRLRLDDDGAWYEGRFRHGVREGRGTLHFPPEDSDSDGGSSDGDSDGDDAGTEGEGNDAAAADDNEEEDEEDDDDNDEEEDETNEEDDDAAKGMKKEDATTNMYPLGGDYVTGMFADDAIEGWAVYHSAADGARREGQWTDGRAGGTLHHVILHSTHASIDDSRYGGPCKTKRMTAGVWWSV
jgi:hypothetical protein